MKKLSLVALALLAVASVAGASQIITPVAAGGVYDGGGWIPLANAFDNQPTWDGTKPVSATIAGGNPENYANRWAYIDLGPDYANIRIESTWTRYRMWSVGDTRAWAGAFWTNTDPTVNDVVPSAYNEFQVKFDSQSALPDTGGNTPWVRDADLTAAPVTPAGRYLVMQVRPEGSQNRAQEYAIVGSIVPEPATMSLLVLGCVAALRRRK